MGPEPTGEVPILLGLRPASRRMRLNEGTDGIHVSIRSDVVWA